MPESTVTILKEVGNPNKARIVAHLSKHKGESAENLGKHLGYPLPTVYKYLRELEAARVIRSEVRDKIRVYQASNFKFEVSPMSLMKAYEEQSFLKLYTSRFGDSGIKRLGQITRSVSAGKITYRQAASTLGVTYYELVSLLDELGVTR